MKKIKHPLKLKTFIRFNVGQGLDKGEAIILGKQKDEDNWVYRIKVVSGSRCEMHMNRDNELWINDIEVVKVINKQPKLKKIKLSKSARELIGK